MSIEITDRQSKIEITEDMRDIIRKCAEKTLLEEGINFKAEYYITLVDDMAIRELNSDFRGVDRATDVLSFPLLNFEGYIRDMPEEDVKLDKNPETGYVVLGDIVISPERASDQAETYGHSIERELGFLTVHGMLHLLGYDHEEAGEREIMREREEYLLHSLGLTR